MNTVKVSRGAICFLKTYLGDGVEHDGQKQVSAIGLLSCLSLVLEERELALDAIPAGQLVDVVEKNDGIEREHEVLHSVDRWEEDFLQVLGGLGCLGEDDVFSGVVELNRVAKGRQTENEHQRVLRRAKPDQLHHPFLLY